MTPRISMTLSACTGVVLAIAVWTAAAGGGGASPTPEPPIVTPALANIGALSRPQTARDEAIAKRVRGDIARLTASAEGLPLSMLPGGAQLDRVRVLLDNVGSHRYSIYAYTTTKGRVCSGLTNGPSGCLTGFAQAGPVDYSVGDPDWVGSGAPAVVWGLSPDHVTGVDIIVDGTARPAVMGNNAFFLEMSSEKTPPSSVEGLVVHFANGSAQLIELNIPVPRMAQRD